MEESSAIAPQGEKETALQVLDPTEELETRIIAILNAIENAERQRARELMVMLFERLAESDAITLAAFRPRIIAVLGMQANTFDAMLVAAKKTLARRARFDSHRQRYAVRDGRICMLTYDPDFREPVATPLCNFDARIIQETVLDEGEGKTEREYLIEGILEDGTPLPVVRVEQRAFGSMRWVASCWGARARVHAGQMNRDRLREAILYLAPNLTTQAAFAHTGWREVEGQHVFCHAGGGLSASTPQGGFAPDGFAKRPLQIHSGSINGYGIEGVVDLDPSLANYRLPMENVRAREGMRASLGILEIGRQGDKEIQGKGDGALVTVWTAMYMAPLGAFIRLDFGVWLYGRTGTLKSTLLALALSHYGTFERSTLPANWESTSNALEKLLFLAKDVPVVIDDFAPPTHAGDIGPLEEKAARLIRAAGNRAGRGRMRGDASLGAMYRPRGLMLASGEQLPSGQSILARTLPVELRSGDIDLNKLTEAQSAAELYPHAMAGYLMWIAEHWDELTVSLPEAWNHKRRAITDSAHLRLPEIYASFAVALDLVLRYAIEIEAATTEEVEAIRTRAHDGWQWVIGKQDKRIAEERPARQFLEVIRELLLSKQAHVNPMRGVRKEGRGKLIGWEDEEFYYLLPKVAYQEAAAYCRRAGGTPLLKQASLFRALYDEGLLETDPEGERTTMLKWAGGGAHRVLSLNKIAVNQALGGERNGYEEEDEDEEGATE